MATLGIPTICLMLLLLLPFYDRSPERHPLKRPIAMIGAVATVAAMAYLSIIGALAGAPSEIDIPVEAKYEEGAAVAASSGCLGCHKIGENGNTLGPSLTEIGDRLGKDAISRTLINPTPPMPSYQSLQKENPEQFEQLVDFIVLPQEGEGRGQVGHTAGVGARLTPDDRLRPRARCPSRRCARCSTASRGCTTG